MRSDRFPKASIFGAVLLSAGAALVPAQAQVPNNPPAVKPPPLAAPTITVRPQNPDLQIRPHKDENKVLLKSYNHLHRLTRGSKSKTFTKGGKEGKGQREGELNTGGASNDDK